MNDRTPRRGTTLIEVLVVTAIFAIVSGTAFALFAGGTRVFSRETVATGLQSDLAGAVNVLLDDASIAGNRYTPTEDGALQALGTFQSVATGTSSDSVSFIGDVDSNGVSDLITYQVTGGSLMRRVQARSGSAWGSETAVTLAAGVQSFTLSFLDANRSSLTSAQVLGGGAKYVRVTLTVLAPSKAGAVSKILFGETAVRNG